MIQHRLSRATPRPFRRSGRPKAAVAALSLAIGLTASVHSATAGGGDFIGGVAAGVIGSALIKGLSQQPVQQNTRPQRSAAPERVAPQESAASKELRQDQANLVTLGYRQVKVDGVRSAGYEAAVVQYKMSKGQVATSILSQTERALLDAEARQRTVLDTIGNPSVDPAIAPRPELRVQAALKALAFYEGALDGKKGKQLQTAISQYQASTGAVATGILSTDQTLRLMEAAVAEAQQRIAAVDRQYAATGIPATAPATGMPPAMGQPATYYNAAAPQPMAPAVVTPAAVKQAAVAPNASAFDPIEPLRKDVQIRRPHDIAIVIGNQNYQNGIPEVSYGVRDAGAMRSVLVNTLGFSPDNVILVENASQGDLATVFGNRESYKGKVWKYIDPDGRSKVFVFYSGHGMPDIQSKAPFILPVDANPATVTINGYPLELIYSNLEKLNVEKAYVFLDACFSGGSNNKMLIQAASPVFVSAKVDTGAKTDKLTIIAASEGDQLASWDEKEGHGLFTEFMLKGLKGDADQNKDGKITASELHAFVLENVRRQARRIYGREQTPVLIGDGTSVLSN